jgi:hypothetical protein
MKFISEALPVAAQHICDQAAPNKRQWVPLEANYLNVQRCQNNEAEPQASIVSFGLLPELLA